jgi:hypothetical protein
MFPNNSILHLASGLELRWQERPESGFCCLHDNFRSYLVASGKMPRRAHNNFKTDQFSRIQKIMFLCSFCGRVITLSFFDMFRRGILCVRRYIFSWSRHYSRSTTVVTMMRYKLVIHDVVAAHWPTTKVNFKCCLFGTTVDLAHYEGGDLEYVWLARAWIV